MAYDISGTVIEVGTVKQISDTFKKREFVIEVSELGASGKEFINYIKFQCLQDKCDLIDEGFLNQAVKISFNIKGRKWEKDGEATYFTNLDAWRIEKTDTGSDSNPETPPPTLEDVPPMTEEENDLPF